MVAIAVEQDGRALGRCRMQVIDAATTATLRAFPIDHVTPGTVVITDGLNAYQAMKGDVHQPIVVKGQSVDASTLLPRVHRVASLLKRWLLGAHQGAVGHTYLDYYLDECTFRVNRRKSASWSKLFHRLAQQAVHIDPVLFRSLVQPQAVGGG